MNAVEALVKEKVETMKRVTALKENTELEVLQKEATVCEHELYELKRPSIFGWIAKLFRKGGNQH